jgi:hypothetical protein
MRFERFMGWIPDRLSIRAQEALESPSRFARA